jgi:hypothetical protein
MMLTSCIVSPWEDRMTDTHFRSFAEFWPHFLRAHSKPLTRAFHYAGMVLAIYFVVHAVATDTPFAFIAALLAPYGLGFFSHYAIEGNNPASARHPLYSIVGAFAMFGRWVTGTLKPELIKAGLPADGWL